MRKRTHELPDFLQLMYLRCTMYISVCMCDHGAEIHRFLGSGQRCYNACHALAFYERTNLASFSEYGF